MLEKESLKETLDALDNLKTGIDYLLREFQWVILFEKYPGLLEVKVDIESNYNDEGGYDSYTKLDEMTFEDAESLLKFASEFKFDNIAEELEEELTDDEYLDALHENLNERLYEIPLDELGLYIFPEGEKTFKRSYYLKNTETFENNFINLMKTLKPELGIEFLFRALPKIVDSKSYVNFLMEIYPKVV